MQRILVALDGSPRAPGVLTAAIKLASSTEGKLTLFRGVGLPAEVPHDVWKLPQDSLMSLLKERAETYLQGCANDVPRELLQGVRVELGAPWEAVCDAAKHIDADVIVIGSHGYGGLDRLIGTTAAKIVNHANCSVLVVRAHASHA
jgi:nucleotide-binding universal stress UspA family protein